MTKIIILGEEPQKKEKKKIEFLKSLGETYRFYDTARTAGSYKFIELICIDYSSGFDLMFAYDDAGKRDGGCLFIGHFNDGVV